MNVPLLGTSYVIISGYDAIYEVLVKKGMAFGGSTTWLRAELVFEKTGSLMSYNPDATWKRLVNIVK
jgi:hypothetical protein